MKKVLYVILSITGSSFAMDNQKEEIYISIKEVLKKLDKEKSPYGPMPLNKKINAYGLIPEHEEKNVYGLIPDEKFYQEMPEESAKKLNVIYDNLPRNHEREYENVKKVNNHKSFFIEPKFDNINNPQKIRQTHNSANYNITENKEIKKDDSHLGNYSELIKKLGLIVAVSNKDLVNTEILLKTKKYDINEKDIKGNTALIIASNNGLIEIVKLLLKENPNLDVQNNLGETALMKACESGYPEIVDLLLKNKADKNIKNKKNQTALDIAKDKNKNEIVKKFEEPNPGRFQTLKKILKKKDN